MAGSHNCTSITVPRTVAAPILSAAGIPATEKLLDLCTAAGDLRSLAVGMSGQLLVEHMRLHHSATRRLSAELVRLLESIGDPTLTVAMLPMTLVTRLEGLEMAEAFRLSQLVIDLAEGDVTEGNLIVGSPLATALGVRGTAKWCLGIADWKDDLGFKGHMAWSRGNGLRPRRVSAKCHISSACRVQTRTLAVVGVEY